MQIFRLNSHCFIIFSQSHPIPECNRYCKVRRKIIIHNKIEKSTWQNDQRIIIIINDFFLYLKMKIRMCMSWYLVALEHTHTHSHICLSGLAQFSVRTTFFHLFFFSDHSLLVKLIKHIHYIHIYLYTFHHFNDAQSVNI